MFFSVTLWVSPGCSSLLQRHTEVLEDEWSCKFDPSVGGREEDQMDEWVYVGGTGWGVTGKSGGMRMP